jgi:hypothetical protein
MGGEMTWLDKANIWPWLDIQYTVKWSVNLQNNYLNVFVSLYDSLYHTSPGVCSKILLTAHHKFKFLKLLLSYFCFSAVEACILSPNSINKETNQKNATIKWPTAEDKHSEKMSKWLLLSWWYYCTFVMC